MKDPWHYMLGRRSYLYRRWYWRNYNMRYLWGLTQFIRDMCHRDKSPEAKFVKKVVK